MLSKPKLVAALLLVAASSTALGLDLAAYERAKKLSPDFMKIYLNALSEGMLYANIELQNTGKAKLYCPPRSLALSPENYMDFIDEEITLRGATPDLNKMPVGLALFRALQRKFPCS